MKKLPVSEAIVEILVANGITHVPGVPGGQTLFIMDAIRRREGIEYVATRHEDAAACMADGQARISNGLAAFLVTTGPGVTNALTGVGGAMRDSSPVLALTVNNRSPHVGRGDNQDADHVAIMQSLTKFSRCVTHPSQVVPVLRDAIRCAINGSPGPVHVDFYRDVVEDGIIDIDVDALAPVERFVCVPDDSALDLALEMLRNSKRPVIWAGRGAVTSRAAQRILEFAEALQAPVVTTFTAMGLMPSNHPLAFTIRTRTGTSIAQQALTEADLLVAVGNRLDAISTTRWNEKLPQIMQIDIEPFEIGRNYPVRLGLQGDASATVGKITAKLRDINHQPSREGIDWVEQLQSNRTTWIRENRKHVAEPSAQPPFNPKTVMAGLNEILPGNLMLSADAGNPGLWTHLLDIPDRYSYLKPVGFANMGHSLPALMGAKLVFPNRPGLCVIGDGSLGMCLAELETLARLDLGIVVCVLNDSAYGNILQEQDHVFGSDYVNIGVELGSVNFALVAEGLGVAGTRIGSINELVDAASRGFVTNKPILLDVVIDREPSVFNRPF